MKKIFIAGASGSVGKSLVLFLQKKKLELHCAYFTTKIYKYKLNNFYTYKIDLEKKTSIKKLIKINPDIIINLAAFTNPKKNEMFPKKSFQKNVIINRNIVNYCKLYGKKLIFTSTDKVYGGNIKKPSETQNLKPEGIYGINKLKCENEIKKKLKQYLILRYASVYSEKKDLFNSLINSQILKIKKRKKVYLATNIFRLFISVEYLVNIIYLLIKFNTAGTFNIGSIPSSYYRLVLNMCKNKKIPYKNLLVKIKMKTDPQYLIPNTNKINYYLKSIGLKNNFLI